MTLKYAHQSSSRHTDQKLMTTTQADLSPEEQYRPLTHATVTINLGEAYSCLTGPLLINTNTPLLCMTLDPNVNL